MKQCCVQGSGKPHGPVRDIYYLEVHKTLPALPGFKVDALQLSEGRTHPFGVYMLWVKTAPAVIPCNNMLFVLAGRWQLHQPCERTPVVCCVQNVKDHQVADLHLCLFLTSSSFSPRPAGWKQSLVCLSSCLSRAFPFALLPLLLGNISRSWDWMGCCCSSFSMQSFSVVLSFLQQQCTSVCAFKVPSTSVQSLV